MYNCNDIYIYICIYIYKQICLTTHILYLSWNKCIFPWMFHEKSSITCFIQRFHKVIIDIMNTRQKYDIYCTHINLFIWSYNFLWSYDIDTIKGNTCGTCCAFLTSAHRFSSSIDIGTKCGKWAETERNSSRNGIKLILRFLYLVIISIAKILRSSYRFI